MEPTEVVARAISCCSCGGEAAVDAVGWDSGVLLSEPLQLSIGVPTPICVDSPSAKLTADAWRNWRSLPLMSPSRSRGSSFHLSCSSLGAGCLWHLRPQLSCEWPQPGGDGAGALQRGDPGRNGHLAPVAVARSESEPCAGSPPLAVRLRLAV